MIKKFKLRGHIIDSLILSKLLDKISDLGVDCCTIDITVGARREEVSEATFIIESDNEEKIQEATKIALKHGAEEIYD